jgi:hypothetical protein
MGTFRSRPNLFSVPSEDTSPLRHARRRLQSDMVDARDAAVGAIVAAAGGLAVGLAKLASSGWLVSVPAFGMKGWQILSVGAFALNVASVGVPGRVDGEMAEEAKRAMAAKKAATKAPSEAETREPAGIPRAHWSRGLVSPAGWAFAIWGPIFGLESAFAAMVGNPKLSSSNPAAAAVFGVVAPYWCAACGLQALWCAAFRPWARKPRHFWLPGALLALEAVALGGAHRAMVLVSGLPGNALTKNAYLCGHLPIAMHFGWITAAFVVSANSFAAVAAWPKQTRVSLAFKSTWLAAAAAAYVSATSNDPVPSFVVAWALAAVASDGGESDAGEINKEALRSLAGAAATAAKLLAAFASALTAKNATNAISFFA